MPEQTAARNFEDDGLLEDEGLAQVLQLHPELVGHSQPAEESVPSVNGVPVRMGELVVLNFMEHPVRDTAASALALGGLGFAVGAAWAQRRRH